MKLSIRLLGVLSMGAESPKLRCRLIKQCFVCQINIQKSLSKENHRKMLLSKY
jgi:hypothetical protein